MGFLASVWFEILLVCASRVDSMLRSSEIRVQIAKNSELHIRRPVMILKIHVQFIYQLMRTIVRWGFWHPSGLRSYWYVLQE